MATSTSVGSIHYDLGLNTSEFDRKQKGMKGKLQSMQPMFKRMAVVGAAATGAIALGIGKAVNEARKAEDIESLFNLAFGNIKDEAQDTAETFSGAFGRSESRIKDSLARVAFQFQASTDLSEKEMLRLSKSMLPAAEGLALLDTNVESGTDVMQAFSDALAGQNQNLGRMIGGYQEADIEQQALNEGIIEQGEELTQTKRALALHSLFMDRTTKSQEKMAQENRGATDKVVQFKDAMRTFMENAGKPFLQGLKDMLGAITPVIEKMGNWAKENPDLVKAIAGTAAVLAGLATIAGIVGLALLAISTPALVITGILAILGAGIFLLIKHWDKVVRFMQPVVSMIENHVKPAFEKLVNLFDKHVMPVLEKIWGIIKDQLMKAWESLKEAIDTVIDVVKENKEEFKKLAIIIGAVLLAPLAIAIATFAVVVAAIVAVIVIAARLIGWLAKLGAWWMETMFNVKRAVNNAIKSVINWFKALPGRIWGFVTRMARLAARGFNWMKDRVVGAAKGIWNTVTHWFNRVVNFVRNLPGKIARNAKGIFNSLWTNFKDAVNNIIRAWNDLKLTLGGGTIPNPIPGRDDFKMPSKTFHTPNIQTLHDGGVFQAPGGRREGLALLESGERVLPKDESGGVHITQNIEQKHVSDPTAWARKLAFELER